MNVRIGITMLVLALVAVILFSGNNDLAAYRSLETYDDEAVLRSNGDEAYHDKWLTIAETAEANGDMQMKPRSTKMDLSNEPKVHFPEVNCTGIIPDNGLRAPTFIIAGAQKAGTTALYNILRHHAYIKTIPKLEGHFFDRVTNLGPADELSDDEICKAREKYQSMFPVKQLLEAKQKGLGIVSFEKTPMYICRANIPALIKRVAPWAKIVLMLRNPITRAYSHWKMSWEMNPDTASFEGFVEKETAVLRKYNLSSAPKFQAFANHSTEFGEGDFLIPKSFQERRLEVSGKVSEMNRGEKKILWSKLGTMCSTIGRGFYAEQIAHWLQHYTLDVDIKIIHYEKFQESQETQLREILDFVGLHEDLDLPEELLTTKYEPVKGRRRKAEKMDEEMKNYLERLYQPYNDELADLLGEEWRGIWNSN